jgi:hypothetical protein
MRDSKGFWPYFDVERTLFPGFPARRAAIGTFHAFYSLTQGERWS